MDLQLHLPRFRFLPSTSLLHLRSSPVRFRSSKLFAVRSSLPFEPHQSKYYKELQAAIDVVNSACRLCVNVQKSLFSEEGGIMEKKDNTPVTIADFGVQALVSLELNKLFPTIPLVAEEDSAFLRSNNLAEAVVNVVNEISPNADKTLSDAELLEAIDRGGKIALAFGSKPATYWVLDPIDGTRGFLKGQNALYVVGLALVVEGEVVLGVMGCPNWHESFVRTNKSKQELPEKVSAPGVIMASHVGCGTWTINIADMLDGVSCGMLTNWSRSCVDHVDLVHNARFCIPESQTWDSLPMSASLTATTNADSLGENQILLLHACCGSLCKYLMVALGKASIFVLRVRSERIIKAWDHVAGMICVQEAGGKVTDWNGRHLNFAADEEERRVIFPEGGVLVSNGSLHTHVLELISSNSTAV